MTMQTVVSVPTNILSIKESLTQFRKEGLIQERPRVYQSKRMTGFNQEVYSAWIERWANNAAINYPIINDSWGTRFLFNSCKNLPALVIGIGPSLDDNIQFLKNAKQRCIVIATDAALRPLIRHGIKPDLVVNYDARKEQSSMWQSIDTKDFTLVANSSTDPITIDRWKGKFLFFNMIQMDDEFATNILPAMYPHLGGLPNMGTVGNGAIYLANEMGCSPILTVGMDLCYQEKWVPDTVDWQNIPGTKKSVGWKYRCDDWKYIKPSVEFPDGQWVQIENKILYDNEARLKDTFDVDHKGTMFKVDEALKFYCNSLLSNIGGLDLPVIDCSNGILAKYIRHFKLDKALEEKCKATIFDGQTVVRHLSKIAPDGKRGRTYSDEDLWKFNPTRGE